MKVLIKHAALTVVLCVAAVAEQRAIETAEQEVTIYIQDRATVPLPVINRAMSQTSAILESAGIHLVWKRGSTTKGNRCRAPIHLVIEKTAPPELRHDVMASTELSSGDITVYYDRFWLTAINWPSLASAHLAQVFAHEIGHSLQRLNRHSDTGIMKARFRSADYHDMQAGLMRFSSEDADLIRMNATRACLTTRASAEREPRP
ncbi:MAG TPA: hypothetical protein VER03_23865 [Bryobacteraceae bacterium]|nr:hypothetical protein [Bryobacteraceae bacterium]